MTTMGDLAPRLSAGTGRFDGNDGGARWTNLNGNGGSPTPSVTTITETQLVIQGGYAYDSDSGSISVDITIGSSDNSCNVQMSVSGAYDNYQVSSVGTYSTNGDSDPTVTFLLDSGDTVVMESFKGRWGWYPGVEFTWGGLPFCYENMSGTSDGGEQNPGPRSSPTNKM